jgi:hypothetical protein
MLLRYLQTSLNILDTISALPKEDGWKVLSIMIYLSLQKISKVLCPSEVASTTGIQT